MPPAAELARRNPAAKTSSWSEWNPGLGRRYTVGAEEEVMLLDRTDYSLAGCSDAVLARLQGRLGSHVSPETHASVLELSTGVHLSALGVGLELAALRRRLAVELGPMGMVAAAAAMHPFSPQSEVAVSAAPRYRRLASSMRWLMQRAPTLALHVHVGVPDPDDAVRVLNRLREHIPVLLALSANSPFSDGRDTGFSSTRTLTFGAFPRTGPPRAYRSYDAYVAAVDPLVALGAIPDATFLWWDVRLQPQLGTVEMRAMDAQTTPRDSAALTALVQSLARLELEGPELGSPTVPEVLEENRFLAARYGIEARLLDPRGSRRVAVRRLVQELLEACRPHAAALGCDAELEHVSLLAARNGAARQRAWMARPGRGAILPMLASRFTGRKKVPPGAISKDKRST
jgi:glutamate---cysteine ligase / carboxylate-amine ligase